MPAGCLALTSVGPAKQTEATCAQTVFHTPCKCKEEENAGNLQQQCVSIEANCIQDEAHGLQSSVSICLHGVGHKPKLKQFLSAGIFIQNIYTKTHTYMHLCNLKPAIGKLSCVTMQWTTAAWYAANCFARDTAVQGACHDSKACIISHLFGDPIQPSATALHPQQGTNVSTP